MKLGVDAYIFDLDGVIVDSMPLHTEAWILYLERFGVRVDRLAERMHGKRNDELVREFFGTGLGEREAAEHGAAKERLYREMLAPRLAARLVPGVAAFLERHAGVRKGLASNAEPANIDFVLGGAGLCHHFEVIVNGEQVERPKPAPDIYFRAAERLRVRMRDCVVFEDSPAGLAAAAAAGARVVAVNTAGVKLPKADLEVADFLDPKLEPWLREIHSC